MSIVHCSIGMYAIYFGIVGLGEGGGRGLLIRWLWGERGGGQRKANGELVMISTNLRIFIGQIILGHLLQPFLQPPPPSKTIPLAPPLFKPFP